ncbi:tyrosine-protein phosphatase [Demequina activiva]|nr:tyrosine-protein phosphatase [Demequina activiva]
MSRPRHALANVRDLADAAPGLVAGIAYRSDAPVAGDGPPEGLDVWPPATVVDLRAPGEKAAQHPLAVHARVVDVDILAAADLTGEAARSTLGSLDELYRLMIGPDTAPGVVRVVEEVAQDDAPVLFHCSAGKDRTGVSAALILRLLGVTRARVVADYTATAAHMPGVLTRMLSGAPASIGDTPLASVPKEVLDAPAHAIEAVLDAWDEHDGGVEGWYLAHGGDAATLAALRARLLA